METTIPFSGFYESLHSGAVDDAEQQIFSDRRTGCTRNQGLEAALFNICDYSGVYTAYAEAYAENFAHEFKIPSMKFLKLRSPREHNFTTDRIFVEISREDAYRIRAETDEWRLRNLARDMFTSRDGFMSFYSPDVDSWGEVEDWDWNQLGCLMAAYADQECNDSDGFDQWGEYNLMSDDFENGALYEWIAENSPGIKRLYKIHDYLETRAER